MTTEQGVREADQGSTQGSNRRPRTGQERPLTGAGSRLELFLQTSALASDARRRQPRRLAVFHAVLVVLVTVFVAVAVARCDSAPACGCSDEHGCSDAAGVDVEQLDQVVELDAADRDADNNACTDDGAACDDDNACTVRDECWGGRCVGSPVKCDDGDMCTRNVCDTLEGCVAIPLTNTWCDAGVPR